MLIIPLNLDTVLLLLHNSKLAYSQVKGFEQRRFLAHNAIFRNRIRKKGL